MFGETYYSDPKDVKRQYLAIEAFSKKWHELPKQGVLLDGDN